MPTDLRRFEFIAYFVGGYVADVVLRSGRKEMSPEELAMIVDGALDNLRGRHASDDHAQGLARDNELLAEKNPSG